jgi:hypothetical protein
MFEERPLADVALRRWKVSHGKIRKITCWQAQPSKKPVLDYLKSVLSDGVFFRWPRRIVDGCLRDASDIVARQRRGAEMPYTAIVLRVAVKDPQPVVNFGAGSDELCVFRVVTARSEKRTLVHIGGERTGSSVSVARLSLRHGGSEFVQGTLAEQVPQRLYLEALLQTEELCTDAFQTLHVWSGSSEPFLALTDPGPSLAEGLPLALLDHPLKPPDAAMDTEVALLQTPDSVETVLQRFVITGASATYLGSIRMRV